MMRCLVVFFALLFSVFSAGYAEVMTLQLPENSKKSKKLVCMYRHIFTMMFPCLFDDDRENMAQKNAEGTELPFTTMS